MHNLMPKVHHAMVTTPHYLASVVGSSIMQRGGNAFDASVAISAALSVVYPHMTGLGGDAFFMLYHANSGRYEGFNGSGRSAAVAKPEIYLDRGMKTIPSRGIESVITVPGMVDSWWNVSSRYGRLPWEQLLEPAIRYAEKGFPISRNLYEWMSEDKKLLSSDSQLSSIYLRSGELINEGDRLIQTNLADSLRILQSEGREGFYSGTLMSRIINAFREDGGILTEDDFRSHMGEWVELISVNYRGFDVYQMPPNSQGFSLLMMLNMLENIDLSLIPRLSADFYHLMAEVVKKAFKERDAHLTDPEFHSIPLSELLSKPHARRLWDDIIGNGTNAAPFQSQVMGQDTAYAAVVDEEGNAVSFIQSLYFDFGSGYMAGDTGIILQNRGSFFDLNADSPNVLEPCKRSSHTLMPAMVGKAGKPHLLIGTQGGEGQPQTQLSVLTGVLDYSLTIQEAIGLPRWVYGRTWGDEADALKLEGRCEQLTADVLGSRGHKVEIVSGWDGVMGQSQGIMIKDDVISGAADPRGDGSVIGW